jgi:DNA-binding ferritin-like protein
MENAASILTTLMGMLTQVKLYHWATMKYSHHKALDELHAALSALVDRFVEAYIGKFKLQPLPKLSVTTAVDTEAVKIEKYLESARDDLQKMYKSFAKASELQNIIDEMMASLDQAIYLCRLS